ncbi:hypothetical protein MNV49_000803 [Pseudohyphozyma bogoriensis]|nr:hypothetical protein MNV49_000803 [Pseudohyphozyma bogoriensis]
MLLLTSILALPAVALAAGKANTFEIVGDTGVSAQQMFLGTANKVYIVDKVQNNSLRINNHPAWATEYDIEANTVRALDIKTNSFCAGGSFLGNGSWLDVGGNQAVEENGVANTDPTLNLSSTTPSGDYQDTDGGRDLRLITPCDDDSCSWTDDMDGMPANRWYPSLETLSDGSIIIIGGELWGGFVNSVSGMQSVPTYEFFPTRGAPVNSSFLEDTQPANLYPLTWLLPSGQLFMQASWSATLLDLDTNGETRLPNITHAQRTYPASAATAMLPLTPSNNYTATLLFCGGMDPVRDDWNQNKWEVIKTPTSSSCVSIDPTSDNPTWTDESDLPENRGMGSFIILPNDLLFLSNGVGHGSAGYGFNLNWTAGQGFAEDPVLRPAYYNHSAPAGQRWDTNLPNSTIPRLYHSSSVLLPDGSVFIAGSSPSADVITKENNGSYPFFTEYRAERFYPSYYDAGRPVPTGLPTSISYGGNSFDISLPASSLNDTGIDNVAVKLIRSGFSTHAYNMGMRSIELNHTYTENSDGSAVLHVSQLPPNANLYVPGPALLFVVVNGIPSIGEMVTVGNGKIENQTLSAATVLPASTSSKAGSSASAGTSATKSGGATVVGVHGAVMAAALVFCGALALAA